MAESSNNEDFPTRSIPGGSESDRPGDFPANPFELSKGDRVGDFEILGEIGQGGMGTVYKAHEVSLKRMVALKVLNPSIYSNPSLAKRFRREAILAANLSHPNIVPVFHIEDSEAPRYFTMELVQGKSLEDKIKKEGFLPPDQAVRIALQACEALQYAHEHNIVHRDIKPSNILLQNHTERVRITDFGIAQDITGKLAHVTEAGLSSPGTPGFESPEQNLGKELDERTDIFSLGMTLYYMLTGRLAYEGENRPQLALAFREQTPSLPCRFNPEISSRIDQIVMKMIAVDPEKRYPSAAAVALALRGSEPGPARFGYEHGGAIRVLRKYRKPLTLALPLVAVIIAISILVRFWPQSAYKYSNVENEVFRYVDKFSRDMPDEFVKSLYIPDHESGTVGYHQPSLKPYELLNYEQLEGAGESKPQLQSKGKGAYLHNAGGGEWWLLGGYIDLTDGTPVPQSEDEFAEYLPALTGTFFVARFSFEDRGFSRLSLLPFHIFLGDFKHQVVYARPVGESDVISWQKCEWNDILTVMGSASYCIESGSERVPKEQVQRYIDLADRLTNTYFKQEVVTLREDKFFAFPECQVGSVEDLINLLRECEEAQGIELHRAVALGDLEKLTSLLAERPKMVNIRLAGFTPLHLAAKLGNTTMAELLIDSGAESNPQDELLGRTPLLYAAMSGHRDMVKLLIDKRADVNAKGDMSGGTPLHKAAEKGFLDVVELLVSTGADVNTEDEYERTPLIMAVQEGHEGIAKFLIARGAKPGPKDKWGHTALHKTAEKGFTDIARLLITAGADVNAKNDSNSTPLEWAAAYGREGVVKLLREHGATLGTEIHNAAYQGDLDKAISLLEKDPNLANARAAFYCTPLHWAAQEGQKEAAELLVTRGAEPNAKDVWGYLPITCAARYGHKDMVELLVTKGADVNVTGPPGFTPLNLAAMWGHEAVVELLVAKGADVNAKNDSNSTPLEWAAAYGHESIAKLLREHDGTLGTEIHNAAYQGDLNKIKSLLEKDPNLANTKNATFGRTPLHWAAQEGQKEVVELLITKGADPNGKDKWGYTPLHRAAAAGHKEVAELLVTNGADVNAADDQQGLTPLHIAVIKGDGSIVELFVARGADVNAANNEGKTPLYLAIQYNHNEVADILRKHGAKE